MTLTDGLTHRIRPAAGSPAGALVLLHGRGADEDDLFPLLDMLDPERRLMGATPRGPLSLPPGGAHWYAVREIGFPDPDTFWPTLELLTGWLDALLAEHNLSHEELVLGGFSQGTVMTHAVGLRTGRPQPAGIIALSGFMPTVEGLELDLANRSGFHAAIGHGAADPVIGVQWGREARESLEEAGAAVTYEEHPGGHQIDPRFLRRLPAWVADALGLAGRVA